LDNEQKRRLAISHLKTELFAFYARQKKQTLTGRRNILRLTVFETCLGVSGAITQF